MTSKKTASKMPSKKTPKSVQAKPLDSLYKATQILLEEVDGLGFLDVTDSEALHKLSNEITGGTLGAGIKAAAKWEKKLAGSLEKFSSTGGDGKLSAVHETLLLWQRKLATLHPHRQGMEQALDTLQRVIPFSGATVYLRDPVRNVVSPYVSHGFQVDLISRVAFDQGKGFASWLATRKKPVLYASLHRNEAPQADVVRSFMAVPILVAEECVGVVTLGHSEGSAYKPSSLRTLVLAGAMLAGFVQRLMADAAVARLQSHDPVSGLLSSGHFECRLEEEVIRCRELGYSMTLVALELPELAGHTERFGKDYLVRSLREIGGIVTDWMRAPEMVGHRGKDRMMVILPGVGGAERARHRISSLTQALEGHSFPRRKRMTTRVAVAAYPSDAESSQDLIAYADRVLQDLECASGGGMSPVPLEAA